MVHSHPWYSQLPVAPVVDDVLTRTVFGDDLVEAHAAAGVEVRLECDVRAPLGGIVAARVWVVDVPDPVHRDPQRRRLPRQDVDAVLVDVR